MRLSILSLIFALTFSCKTKELTPNDYDKDMIFIGSGGGFTGASTSYYILQTGDVFQNGLNDTTFIKIGKIKSKLIKQQFDLYYKLNLNNTELNEPGNRYHFIGMKNGDKEHKLQWGYGKLENPTIDILHSNIMGLIKQLNKKKD